MRKIFLISLFLNALFIMVFAFIGYAKKDKIVGWFERLGGVRQQSVNFQSLILTH